MSPEDIEKELRTLRERSHEQAQFLTVAGAKVDQINSATPVIFKKLDDLKDMMHSHGTETEKLKGAFSTLGAEMKGAVDLTNTRMVAADNATDAKVNTHLEAHRRWFPLVLTLAGAAIIALATALWNLLKTKGG